MLQEKLKILVEHLNMMRKKKKKKKLVKVEGELVVASIDTANEKREHLKSEEIFDATKFPKITFKSTKLKKIQYTEI